MIETRQNSYLVRYAVKLLIFTEIFMFMTIIILYGTLEKIIPTFLEKILYGYMSITGYLQYIIHFKNAKIYFFELSAINNKKIKNAFCIELNENNIKKFKKGLINYKFTYTFDDGLKTIIQIPKKVNKLYLQSQYAEKFFNEYIEG